MALKTILHHSDFLSLLDSVNAEVAALEAEATHAVLKEPDAFLHSHALNKAAEVALHKAARLQTFMDVAEEISEQGFRFRSAKITVLRAETV